MPRVAYLLNRLAIAGAERDALYLCERADRREVTPSLVTLEPGGLLLPALQKIGDVPLTVLPRKSKFGLATAYQLARQIASLDVDVIHVSLPTIGFYVALARFLFPRTCPPVLYLEVTSQNPSWPINAMERVFYWRNFDLFAGNSEASCQKLVRQGVSRERIRILPNAHDLAPFAAAQTRRQQLRDQHPQLGSAPLVLSICRLIPSKRIGDALEAFSQIHAAYPQARYWIVGDGPDRANLEQRAAALGLTEVVTFWGMRSDVHELLAMADLFVFPSEIEGLPNSVVEAALSGLPIAASNIGGVCEAVGPSISSELVPVRSPGRLAVRMKKLLDHPEAARVEAATVRRYAEERFAADKVLNLIYAAYRETEAAGKGRRKVNGSDAR